MQTEGALACCPSFDKPNVYRELGIRRVEVDDKEATLAEDFCFYF